MKLRKVDIVGFKSFRNRVSLDIADGMTSIVGPNGCGKSNVVDAIKWAMGDMSAKSLRGEKMEDVIFAGSDVFRAAGMAEVTMIFDNEGKEWIGEDEPDANMGDSIPREFRNVSTIAVTRRLHRSGESEYLINNTKCRLLDIQNLLAGTGIGKQGYSVIEQGQVGFIVSSKPTERRRLIEEASGITRYKAQRDRSERKLLRTEENLTRVDDILSEVAKQIRSLERQAKRAARHREFSVELKALEVSLLIARHSELSSEVGLLDEQFDALQKNQDKAKDALEKTETNVMLKKRAAIEIEQKHAEVTEVFYRLDTKLNLAKSRAEHAKVALQEAERRLGSSEQEFAAQQTRLEELKSELLQVTAELESIEDVDKYASSLTEAETALSTLKQSLQASEKERQSLRDRLENYKRESHRNVDRLQWISSQISNLEQREKQLEVEVENASLEFAERSGNLEKLAAEKGAVEKRLESSRERQTKFNADTMELEKGFREYSQNLAAIRSKRIDLETRIGGLESMRESGAGYDDAVQLVLSWAKKNDRKDVFGPLGDFVVTKAGEENAIVNYLGVTVEDIVVASHDTVKEIAKILGDDLPGAVGFWVIPSNKTPHEAVASILDDLDSESEYRIPNEGKAVALPDGSVIFGNGHVRIGKDQGVGANVLRQRQLLRDLEVESVEIRRDEEKLKKETENMEVTLSELRHKSKLAKQETETLSLDLHRIKTDLDSSEREVKRIQENTERLRSQLIPIFSQMEALKSESETLASSKGELEQQISDLEQDFQAIDASLAGVRNALETHQSDVMSKKVALAELNERKRNLAFTRERLTRSIESTATLIGKYSSESVQQRERIAGLRETIFLAENEVLESSSGLEERKEEVEAAKTELKEVQSAVSEFEKVERTDREHIATLAAKKQKLEFKKQESQIGADHIVEQLQERFEVELEEGQLLAEKVETPSEERKTRRDHLRKRLESIGPVNAMAEEEYIEAQERFTFLDEQKQDLDQAIHDLRTAISRMDKESRRRFKETFEAVNAKFKQIFPSLFNGGKAELALTDPNDMLNTGVDIFVQPPGKKNQSVMLLSGGEKALTAVALIFSIFILKPTPFAILDEVDAPLDEANVGRFARIVQELSSTSQMIVITHSRRTMEASDMLYGVTMEDPGSSKIVSVRLSEIDDKIAS